MRYRDLAQWVSTMTPEQLDCHVTILDSSNDEFYPLADDPAQEAQEDDDRLDEGHPYLVI